MTTPTSCTGCGHELGIGRFCTNCGQPVPGRHPDAVPASSAPFSAPTVLQPTVPPPTGQVPPAARYPLFADMTQVDLAPEPPMPPASPAPTGHLPQPPPATPPGRRTPWLPWLAAILALVLIAALGAVLLLGSDDSGDGSARADTPTDAPTTAPTKPTPPRGDGSETTRPDSQGTGGFVEAPAPADLSDLTADASVSVPATAPPSRDRRNRPVTFAATNLLDGRPRTAWRMPGDGTGSTIVLNLGREMVLTEVGLINGYAKVGGGDNWYAGNRRIRAVQWEFDDGTRITQDLTDRVTMQLLPVGPLATTTVVMRLVEVSAPGAGPNGRDFTAISDVRLRGAPR